MDYREISRFGLQEFLEEVILIIGPDPSIIITTPHYDVELNAYRYGLHVILQNLISNAIKYNDKPSPLIEIGFRQDESQYHFTVKDNGPGIAPEFHEVIFGQFQTLGQTDRFGNTGTGLGLSMVRDVISKMHGTISMESALEKGTIFTISFPTAIS